MNFDDFNLNKQDWIYLVILVAFSFLCTTGVMLSRMPGGLLFPDAALYLISALKYAGLDFYNVADPKDLFYTPVISFLTSLFFRMGYVDKNAIIFVTSFFSFFAYVGMFFLLKNRFNSLLSLTGVIIFGSLSEVIFSISKGMIDVPVVSISIWVLVFAIMAIDKNPKYFLVAFPLLVMAFFTKYVAGFILPLILLYYCMSRNIVDKFDCFLHDRTAFKQKLKCYLSSREFKYIIFSLLISLILALIICKTLILDFGGSLSFFQQSTETFNGHAYSTSGFDYNIDKSYYLDHLYDLFFKYMDFSYILVVLYGICGLGLIMKGIKNFNILKSEKRPFKTKYLEKILIVASAVLIFASFLTFNVIPNHLVSNICLLISLTFIHSILQKFEVDNRILSLDLLFLAYLLINFIFVSIYPVKVLRYALPFIPPIIYFVILGLDGIVEDIDFNKLSKIKPDKSIPIILMIIFLIPTATAIYSMEFGNDLDESCVFIMNNDSDYHNESFAAYFGHSRIIRWYLNVNVTTLGIGDPNLETFDNTTYVILDDDIDFKNYHIIKTYGNFNVYHHD
ncbi:ArnT family glycosyltransferase [Methanobrevibacter sp.]|uniref:ArnT family glycosyltransferase n=1 Tax=Methanobrevibacter sp. TaxID=66852 RepID=UPI0038907904